MERKVNFKEVLNFTRLSVYLAQTWPPPINATKWHMAKYHATWCLAFLSVLCLTIPLMFSISKYYANSLIVTQSVTFVGGISNLVIKMSIYRIHLKRTQILIKEMEDFLKNAQPHETAVCRRYVGRCASFHFFITFLNYLTTAMIALTPLLVRDQALPTSAVYPFAVNAGIVMLGVYLHQALVAFQCSAGVTIDCQTALMLWFAGARIEILADELKYLNDVKGLKIIVAKHRKLIAYAVDVSDTMAYIALTSSMACGIGAVMSCLQLCSNEPVLVKMQFIPLTLIASMNLFICAWPADNLINVCSRLERAVYNTSWSHMSPDMMKNIVIFLQRCQRPVIVSVGGFLPTLSLAFYASFLSSIFTYFTTHRIIMTPPEKNN